MRNKFLLSLFFPVFVLAQSGKTKNLEGRVTSTDGDVAATHVMNLTTQRATITDINGFFSIPVRMNDTLVFSAVQLKKKQIIVTPSIFESTTVVVPLDEALEELDEVIVTPYNLSGNISKDLERLDTEPVVTASTLELPNAYVKKMTQSERLLRSASYIPFEGAKLAFDPIINSITGRTKMLKKRVERDKIYSRTERVREFYADSLYRTKLKIPENKTDDFFYFCEVDTAFQKIVDTHDLFKIWEYLEQRSLVYRTNNGLD
ncbi:hypothetical protein [Maribacter cobaltidurans]|uniref:Uncharacterized protein n=1 Tax=Maribacter cobaltidurans TaxID=1178778 RepID=A0A223V7M8_9FLAO|nr:hypothetical protein [Maribacter cobaltidurans]ASV31217.1 hypothetical protein CJ263_13890 [Maribacter cobaltidurans]GGD84124.1 hypothetical protein GCM10011412_22380 [Maribacter cobaltidurans]